MLFAGGVVVVGVGVGAVWVQMRGWISCGGGSAFKVSAGFVIGCYRFWSNSVAELCWLVMVRFQTGCFSWEQLFLA